MKNPIFKLLILAALLCASCSSKNGAQENEKPHLKYNSEEEMRANKNLVLGIHTGFVFVDNICREKFPNAKIEYYNTAPDMAYLVSTGKLDGFIDDEPIIRYGALTYPNLGYIRCGIDAMNIVVAFPKTQSGGELRDEFNILIEDFRKSGELERMDALWLGSDEDKKIVEIPQAQEGKPTLRLGTSATNAPFDYVKDEKIVGYEIDLISRFCKKNGYGLEIQNVPFDSLILGLNAGVYDFAASVLSDTPAHKESLNLSNSIYESEPVMAVQILGGENKSSSAKSFSSLAELNSEGVKIGIHTGTTFDETSKKLFPKAEVGYYTANIDMAKLVAIGKLDAFLCDEPVAKTLCANIDSIKCLSEYAEKAEFAFAFPRNEIGAKLKSQIDEFIEKSKKDGTKQNIESIWFGEDESAKKIDFSALTGENGTIRLATNAEYPPFEYIKDGKVVGYDIDWTVRFCKEYGYALSIDDMNFDAVIPSIVSEKYDFAVSGLSITEERKQSVDFSLPNYQGGAVAVVRDDASSKNQTKTLADFNSENMKIGVATGTTFDALATEFFPKSKCSYFNSVTDMANLVSKGQLDAVIVDESTALVLCKNINGIDILPESLESANYAIAFPKTPKGDAWKIMMDEFLRESKENGEMQKWREIWFGTDESKKNIDISALDGKNGQIRMATNAEYAPFEYIKDNKFAGYDIECVYRFCEKYGYSLEITDMNFDAILPSLVSDSYDFAAAGMSVTEERAQSVNFSIPNYDGKTVVLVRAENQEQDKTDSSVFSSLELSFEKTFIRESRWKLVLHGVGITILISIFSAIFGTILGFGFCAMRLSKNKILDALALVYIRLMQGLPMVVLLMILFYIVFAKTNLNGIWVAVIGFGMNFGAYVSEMIRTGIIAVDRGQTEAALALGYTKPLAFARVVLPQAARHFLPVFQGEFISLVKMTSVVGYIAIQDLTKASDIIRSRTYEAFFPLVTTAIIYFAISWLLSRVLTAIQGRLDPKKRRGGKK